MAPELRLAYDALTADKAEQIAAILAVKAPHLDQDERLVRARVIMTAVIDLLPLVQEADEAQRPAIVAEIKRLTLACLEASTVGGSSSQ